MRGNLAEIQPSRAVVEVQGVGYEVLISLNTYRYIKEKSDVHLLTHEIIRDDLRKLVGFSDSAERKAFQALVSVNGVGPIVALVVLSSMSPPELAAILRSEDAKALCNIKGIGSQTSRRIVLELHSKVTWEQDAAASKFPERTRNFETALAGLINLQIPRQTAIKTLQSVVEGDDDLTVEQMIRLSLQKS